MSLTIRFISRTIAYEVIKMLTFIGDGHDLMLRVGVLQDALGAEHLLVTFAEELHFFVFVGIAILDAAVFRRSWGALIGA
jgi:hypothetical protein